MIRRALGPAWFAACCSGAVAGAVGCAPVVDARALPADGDVVLVGAGDIGDCSSEESETASLVQQVLASSAAARAFTLGDNAYQHGALTDFTRCYAPSWGRFRERTIPVAGNHDWKTPGAAGFRAYFDVVDGAPTYSATFLHAADSNPDSPSTASPGWLVLALDSDCAHVGGCGAGSPQAAFVAQALLEHRNACVMALWHHPLFTSGTHHGPSTRMRYLWSLLDAAGATLVVTGHEHLYERFDALHAPSDSNDGAGIVSFVAGTGGGSHYRFGDAAPASAARIAGTSGVLELALDDDGWRSFFIADNGAVLDEASGACRER